MLTNKIIKEKRKAFPVSKKVVIVPCFLSTLAYLFLALFVDNITVNPLYIVLVSGLVLTPLFTFLTIGERKEYIGFACEEAIHQHRTIDEVLAKLKRIGYEFQYIALLILSILTILSKLWITQTLWISILIIVSILIFHKSYLGISGHFRYNKIINLN